MVQEGNSPLIFSAYTCNIEIAPGTFRHQVSGGKISINWKNIGKNKKKMIKELDRLIYEERFKELNIYGIAH